MKKELRCIMLVDDDQHDNFFHSREIKKYDSAAIVLAKNTGLAAIEYLQARRDDTSIHPDLIFVDINMPGMNGWEFLEVYNRLDQQLQRCVIILMLSCSDNADDEARLKRWSFVSDFITKPLTKEIVGMINAKYFNVSSI